MSLQKMFAGFALLAAIAVNQPAFAQSPEKMLTASIAGKQIKMDYFAPSMRGRKIYGELVPFGKLWCPGANWATTITVDSDFQLGTLKLMKGSYALWVIPDAKEFELVVARDVKSFHLDHKTDSEIAHMKMNMKALDKPVELLTFEVRPDGGNKGTVALIWENTEASVPIVVGP